MKLFTRRSWVVALAAGCGAPVAATPPAAPAQPRAATTVDVTPKGAPGFVAGYDFELLDAVEGNGCYTVGDTNTFSAVVPGVDLSVANDVFATNALHAAAYDALSKLQGADTILVTRMRTSYESATKVCASVSGRGIRLLKGNGPPVAPAPSPAPEREPKPSAESKPPAAK